MSGLGIRLKPETSQCGLDFRKLAKGNRSWSSSLRAEQGVIENPDENSGE
jgi:hypothetical protein